jgi:ABC-type transport system substrate-binding protein
MKLAWLFRGKVLVSSLIMLLAMVAVACGSSATVAPVPPTATRAPAPTAAAAAGPAATLAVPAFTAPTKAAAPVPAATTAPVAAVRGKPKVETLVIAVDPAAGETSLHWAGTVDHHQQFDLVSEVLVDIDPKTNLWVPELAKSWQMSPDGKEWTFQLAKGVQWHNNFGEFTAKDVLHSIANYQRKDAILAYANDFRQIDLEKSRAVGDYEVVISLKNPNPDYLFYLAPSGGGLMMSKAQWDKGGDEAYKQDMIGTGPYRFTGRTFGVNATYELLPNHWRRNNPAPDFKKVDLRWIKEPASRNAGLLANEIHLTELTRELADAAVAKKMKIIQSNFPGNTLTGVFQGMYPAEAGKFEAGFMYPNLPFQNIKVREAMNRALDKETLAKTLFSGRVTIAPMNGFYPTLPGWNPDWLKNFDAKYGYDPKKARALLAEAGYGPNNPIKMKGILMNFFGFPESQDAMQAMDVMFRDVGINLTLEEWEFSKYFAAWTNKKPESVNAVWLSPPSYKTVYAQLSLFYRSSGAIHFYETPALDALFAKLQASVDPAARDQIQREMGNILYDEYAHMPLFYIFIEFVANPNIIDQWPFPGSDGANYGHFDLITACTTPTPCLN